MLILVCGTSRGIGFEIVKRLAESPANRVIAVSRQTASLQKLVKKGGYSNVQVVAADISRAGGRRRVSAAVKKLKLRVDVLINNAAILINKPFSKIGEKDLLEIYRTNVFAPFHLTQELLPYFAPSQSHIVNISSMGAFQGSAKFAGLSAYSSSKAALANLSECLAEELRPKKIAVNCLAIGAVQTEMLSEAFPGYKAPLSAADMAAYICDFSMKGQKYFNGKILPVSLSTP